MNEHFGEIDEDEGFDYEPEGSLPSKPIPTKAKLSGVPTEKTKAFSDFINDLGNSQSVEKKGTEVLGKNISVSDARKLRKKAITALRDQFSLYELARIMQDRRYSLDSYLATLREIRDDPGQSGKIRIEAADKIIRTAVGILNDETRCDNNNPEMMDFTKTSSDEDKRLLSAVTVVQATATDVGVSEYSPEPPKILLAKTGDKNGKNSSET